MGIPTMTAELDPTAEASQAPSFVATDPISSGNIRTFLMVRQKNFGDITGDRYDREVYGGDFLDFVMEATEQRRKPDEEPVPLDKAAVEGLLQRYAFLRNKGSATALAYRAFEQAQLKKAAVMKDHQPHVKIAFELAGALERTDAAPIATDVIVAISRVVEYSLEGVNSSEDEF